MHRTESTENKHTNHLIDENSPYLLSHAHNPVDWYPWGDEALSRAKAEDKPIFLSIGYAACHWCHVMEQESFENEGIAAILNEHFISIKVDREQRPDLDQIYMTFTQAMTGSGGWPMSVFLTPDLKPFFAGTYFPPEDQFGRPGFKKVLTEIAAAYNGPDKQSILESSRKIFDQIESYSATDAPRAILNHGMVEQSARALMRNFDDAYGGFGQAPKFPHSVELSLFLRQFNTSGDSLYLHSAEMALTAMANGGIYDHLGGGFARYSTDRKWLVPHFEKMLYDNGLLVPTYVDAYQITENPTCLKTVRQTLDFILREMTDSTGGFYSAIDADSEGEEGKFYVWDKSEIDALLGDRSELFCEYYNVTSSGNFEGKNILHITAASERIKQEADVGDFDEFLAECREVLFEARSRRVRPLTDDKILTSWNGLALSAFCRGYQATGERRYLEAARKNAEFVHDELYRNNELTHSYRMGRHSDGHFLEDHAYYIRGLLDLYQTDLENNQRWLQFAGELATQAVDLFMEDDGTLYLRPAGKSDLIMRPRDETDGALPAPGSFLIAGLFKLNRITGDKSYLEAGEKGLRAVSSHIEKYPSGMAAAVIALDYYLNDKIEIVIVGNGSGRQAMVNEIYQTYLPNKLLAVSSGGGEELPLFEGRSASGSEATAFVCRNSVCKLPVSSSEELKKLLNEI